MNVGLFIYCYVQHSQRRNTTFQMLEKLEVAISYTINRTLLQVADGQLGH
jgi:hypothetical protein